MITSADASLGENRVVANTTKKLNVSVNPNNLMGMRMG